MSAPRLPRFGALLAAMFVELLLLPVELTSVGGMEVARLTGAAVLLAALSVVGWRRLNLILITPVLIAELVIAHSSASGLLILRTTLRFLFLTYALGLIVWHVLRERNVTWDTVAGAACAYLLVAVVWANLYQLVEWIMPGSFVVPDPWRIGRSRDPSAALSYFSLGTMMTMTYGDIRPTNLTAGSLCMSETLVGQLYLAIMIARLVGVRIAVAPPSAQRRAVK